MMSGRYVIVIAGVCLSLLLLIVAWLNIDYLVYGLLLGAPSSWSAEYDDMSCRGKDEVEAISTDLEFSKTAQLASLYVQTPDGEVFLVPELTEDIARGWLDAALDDIGMPDLGAMPQDLLGLGWSFENGRIVAFAILEDSEFRIGVSPDGPFHRLPFDHETMRELFGEDFEWVFHQSKGVH